MELLGISAEQEIAGKNNSFAQRGSIPDIHTIYPAPKGQEGEGFLLHYL